MHIKKLEICGFKSFVDRTVIHFDHDVIGIVGPNGCGKSNIVDSIRWCMGEQSPKHLRGRAMEDVIFNGSESRGPHGFAEVTMTFDNTDKEYARSLPVEFANFAEIAITRRLFRDGTSEYLINRTVVRLRDVTDLFLGTGVGTKAYSIVEQGRIGQIVTSRAEDRRLFIEEAAGITKYKKHRREAERKMEQTRQNLLRVGDIIAEIERTRSSLKRQAAKAERFVVYREELEELMLHQSSHQLLEIIVMDQVFREALHRAGVETTEARARVQTDELSLTTARTEAAEVEERSEAAAQAAFKADNAVSILNGELTRAKDQLAHLDQRLTASGVEKETLSTRIAELTAEKAELESRLRALEADAEERGTDATAEETALDELRKEADGADQLAETLRREVADASTSAAAVRARLDGVGRRISEHSARRDRTAAELESISEELENLVAHEAALRRSVAEREEGKRLSAVELAELERDLEGLRPQARDAERTLDTAKNELALKRSRLRALEDLHRRLEGVGTGVRALLSGGEAGVLGMVADRLEVPEEYTAAVTGLLGDRLQCVVVADPERGVELLDALRASGRGRATVLPENPRYVAGARRTAAPEEPAIGWVADVLGYAPGHEGLVRALVGDAVLCNTPAEALAVVRQTAGVTAVSLDGTVVRPDGIISGGSSDDVASAMLEQKREMRQLAHEVELRDRQVHDAAEAHRTLRARMTELGASLDRARTGAHETELLHVGAEKDLSRTVSEAERATRRRATLATELAELARSLEAAHGEETAARAQLDDLERRLEQGRTALARASEGAAAWKERVSAHATLVTERKVRLAQVREQVEGSRSAIARLASSLSDNVERSRRVEEDACAAAESFGQTAAHIVKAREERAAAHGVAEAAHQVHDEIRKRLDELRGVLGEQEAALRALRGALSTLEESGREHELRVQKLELEREHLLQGVRERFRGLDLHRIVGKYHARPAPDAEHRRRIDELAKLIERMGPVNLDAKTEYEDAETRFVELNGQKEDIDKALLDLERAIKHMNKESRRRFKETFDSVNELFKRTFHELFRGGKAELSLTNPEDLLETGVEIMAQPPGKRLGNIELMSGGEKALTATALIFAIFRHRPSPFCILDEVDAPLDEANVKRYNEAIRRMTERSQFILITHIKSTMQSVDVLYGVTMGEPGVSRIVSVKVNEEATSRSERERPLELEAAADVALEQQSVSA
ncbi:MAG TPA: chromosome segregation protein SMC [Polyangiaceae bacterium]|jgi:chromosome segregation protein|nr:chromosome segregation protein SMC [Polyangiaceae bacterium]